MPTTVFDQFFVVDANTPPSVGTTLPVSSFSLYDANDNGSISSSTSDQVNGVGVDSIWVGDVLTIELPGGSQVTYTGASIYLDGGGSLFTPTDGQVLQQGTFVSSNVSGASSQPLSMAQLGPPCFRDDALILTPDGPRPVAALRPGDLVETADHGALPILHLQTRRIETWYQKINPGFCPVRIPKGALGEGLPNADLHLSAQHRIAVSSAIVARMFDTPTVLVPVAKLVGTQGITRPKPRAAVTYCHIVLERHALIWANGLAAETFLLGPRSDHLLGKAVVADLTAEMVARDAPPMTPARPIVDDKRVKSLLRRHLQNAHPLKQEQTSEPVAL